MSLKVNVSLTGSFTGHNGIGACTLSGARVNDIVLHIYTPAETPGSTDKIGAFETTISVDDQVQQTLALDFSSTTLDIILLRPITVG